ncbi:MAG: alginate lyase family protein [Methylococcaceae bacterium]|nr:alginate lyase family protein [Methylococcaceae bacterium]
MSAVPVIERSSPIDFLKAPYSTWSADELLSYFQTRNGISYFTVVNEAEITPEKIDAILSNAFTLNEETYSFDDRVDWLNNPSTDIEWSIMLHKFYYAVGLGIAFQETGDDRYADQWMELTSSWIATVPVDFLSSDVTGRRIQNWVFAHYYFVSECRAKSITPEFYLAFLKSLHQQVTYLCQHLTPARNHRTLELYTVFLVAVIFPELKDAKHWLQFSMAELVENIQSDILDDGVHCELSTDYHHIVLRNFLAVRRLAAMNNIAFPQEFDERIKKALAFSVYVHKPDGTIPSLSDGDTGCFLALLEQGYELYGSEDMRYVATQGKFGIPPNLRSKAFLSGGYYILRSGWGESSEDYRDERYFVFDCGDLGAGNHGHLDLLSFEMAAYGQSLVVDPGRYTYDESGEINWRVLFRGTSYHNTVSVDAKNQTRYEFHKEKFKIKGRQPDYELKTFISRPGFDYLHGIANSHEYPVTHERKILFINGEYWLICDVLRANETHSYDQLFHLSSTALNKVSLSADLQSLRVDSPHLLMIQPVLGTGTVSLEGGYISPTYGIKQEAPIIKFSQQGTNCCFYTLLYPYKDKRPAISISMEPVHKNNRMCYAINATYLTIEIETETQLTCDSIFIANESGDYQAGAQSLNSSVVHKRTSSEGHVLSQFDFAELTSNDWLHGDSQ